MATEIKPTDMGSHEATTVHAEINFGVGLHQGFHQGEVTGGYGEGLSFVNGGVAKHMDSPYSFDDCYVGAGGFGGVWGNQGLAGVKISGGLTEYGRSNGGQISLLAGARFDFQKPVTPLIGGELFIEAFKNTKGTTRTGFSLTVLDDPIQGDFYLGGALHFIFDQKETA